MGQHGDAARVVDAQGLYVTPGLIDLHTHCYWGATFWGIEADPVAARSGVTTWLDVGSSGAYSFAGFRRYAVEASRARLFALLNISMADAAILCWEGKFSFSYWRPITAIPQRSPWT